MSNRKQTGAIILLICLLLGLFVSSAYIVHEANHDCTGEDCTVCQMIAISTELMRVLTLAVLLFLAAILLLQGASARLAYDAVCLSFAGTLVSWKIRLND